MTSTETPAEVPDRTDLPTQYRRDRARLYHALVLIFGNRDIAVEAVDRAYARWGSRRRRRRASLPDVQVFAAGYAWARRKLRAPDRVMQGFRLPGAETLAGNEAVLAAFDRLEVDDRALLTGRYYLGWDSTATAAALGLAAGEIDPRTESAVSRLARHAGPEREAAAADLPQALEDRAATLPEPLSRLEGVRARARVRRVGLTLAGSTAGLALGAGTVLGIQQILEDDTPPVTHVAGSAAPSANASSPGTASGVAPSPLFTSPQLVWNRIELPLREGEVTSVAFGPSGFVGVGMAWSPEAQSLSLLSEDGATWELGPGPLEGGNGWIGQMTIAGDRYVAVGNSFDEFRGRDTPLVAVSTDGLDWLPAELPIESELELGGRLVNVHTSINQVAARGDRVVVFGFQNLEFDPMDLVREQLPGDVVLNNFGWSGRGIEIYDDNGNLERLLPWDELGLEADVVSLITSGRPIMWTSDDFETWEMKALSGFGPDSWVSSIASGEGVFVASVGGQFGQALWTSSDGVEWERADVGDRGANINSVASNGELLVAGGSDIEGRGSLWTSPDGVTWNHANPPGDEVGWIERVFASSAGFVALAQPNAGQTAGPAEVLVGDLVVQVSQSGSYTILDKDGEEIAVLFGEDLTYEEDGSITLADPETGDVLASFTQEELNAAWEIAWREFEIEGPGFAGPQYTLLVSPDGLTWSSFDLADHVTGFYPSAVALGREAIVMTGWSEEGGFEGGGVAMWLGTPG